MSINASNNYAYQKSLFIGVARAILAAFGFWALGLSSAAAETSSAFEPGGVLYASLHGNAASKKVTRKLRRKVRRTNIGGIAKKRTRRVKRSTRKSRSRRKNRNVRVASLGNSFKYARSPSTGKPKRRKSITGGGRGVQWVASSGCLNGRLKSAIYYVARNFGRVRVNSTCRSRRRNRRVGGARRSYHLTGDAADIRIWGNVRAAARYLRSVAGGYKHYGGGLFHIDTGPRRTW